MPRFDRLEFEPPPENGAPAARPAPDRDERDWLRLADAERRQGLYENALRFYSRALELDKALVGGWLGQVQMLVALDEYPEAELWARKALELFRGNAELLAGRAQALCRLGDYKPALELSDAALRQEGQSAYRWLVRGELMASRRDEIDRHCFEKAAYADPDWLVPLEIALVYRHYRNPAKAVAWARQAVQKAPDSAYAWYVQGGIETDLGLRDPARQSFRRCLALAPQHAAARDRLTELDNEGWSLGRLVGRLFRRG
jgi:tetratricopeptide (TPR) repeat protein